MENDVNIIEYGVKLSPVSQEIYNNVTNLVNNITFKNPIAKIVKNMNQLFYISLLYYNEIWLRGCFDENGESPMLCKYI